jgi:RNA polymerase sigma-70 factor (ECF subfamily)
VELNLVPDAELLARCRKEPAAFGEFYGRHERAVFSYLFRRTRDAELAADLSAETFARALLAAGRFQDGPDPAIAWMLGIARNVLGHSLRRRQVDDRARRKLRMAPLVLEDSTLAALERLHAHDLLSGALERLPKAQAQAVRARIVDERDYDEIAADLRTSQAVVRQRVSRGLAELRRQLGDTK